VPEAWTDWPQQNPSPELETALSDRAAFREVLRRTVEGELLPRILTQLRAGPIRRTPPMAATAGLPRSAFQHFMRLVRRGDDPALRRYLHGLLDQGHRIDVIFDDLLAPAARRLGHLWESDDADFVEVTLACARLQRAVCRLGRMADEPGDGQVRGRLLLCGMDEDQHTLGGVLLAEIFIREGWMVTLAPPFANGRPTGEYDLICFSLASLDRADEAARRLATLRHRHGHEAKLILGGNAILRDPDLINAFNADGWARDADGAAALARELAPMRPQATGVHETADD
jgi:hypothetical protein